MYQGGSSSIWLLQERKTRFGLSINDERLETLRNKRLRYLTSAITRILKRNRKKGLRLQMRLSYTSIT